MAQKKALITGITGQDGSYLADLLLEKNYQVIGMVSDTNDIGMQNIGHLKENVTLETGDLLDKSSLERLIKRHKPEEVYNLAGISFVPLSWEKPELTYNVNAMGVLRILEVMRDTSPNSRLFQASSGRMFGQSEEERQDEATPFHPQDPYAVSKTAAHESVRLFREHFGLFAGCGILFNHESERRGPEFVTRKITQGAAKIKLGLEKKLGLGNLEAKQDWGYARDYVNGMWLMLQQDKPDDFVFATGELHSVREVCEIAFSYVGLDYSQCVTREESFYRPLPSKNYFGDPAKAEKVLGWKRHLTFKEMIVKMVESDVAQLQN